MKRAGLSIFIAGMVLMSGAVVQAEILAMLNYESKPEQMVRKEGLAIIDVDPKSPTFAKILMDIPLPPDLIAHHIFYNRDMSKAYVTALGKSILHVLDLRRHQLQHAAAVVAPLQLGAEGRQAVHKSEHEVRGADCAGDDPIGRVGGERPGRVQHRQNTIEHRHLRRGGPQPHRPQ